MKWRIVKDGDTRVRFTLCLLPRQFQGQIYWLEPMWIREEKYFFRAPGWRIVEIIKKGWSRGD